METTGFGANAAQASTNESSPRKLLCGAIGYVLLLGIFSLIAAFFHLKALQEYPLSTFLSFALLFLPYWFLGFGTAPLVRRWLPTASLRIVAASLLSLPYFVLTIPRQNFQWSMAATLIAIAVLTTAVLERWPSPANWADLVVLATLGLTIDLGLLSSAWPLATNGLPVWPAGLGGFPKLMMADVALFCYLVAKPIDGLGYDLVPRLSDLKIGLREFIFYAPIVIPLGLWMGFLHFHRGMPHPAMVPSAWIFTFVFVALPEELFFRGLVQNLLERRVGRIPALCIASVLFGLSHFNKRAVFNWRYVLLAAIAGFFYGRAWREQRRLFASSITHTSVDTVWSIWFR